MPRFRAHTDRPRDRAEPLARLAPAEVLIPIRERTPVTATRLGAMPGLRLISAHETLDRFMALAVDNAVVFLDGVPRHVVNSEALNRSSRAS